MKTINKCEKCGETLTGENYRTITLENGLQIVIDCPHCGVIGEKILHASEINSILK